MEWQRVNREAIDESGKGDDMMFFSRSGYTQSPGIATMFWLGDQLMTWDEYDGIKTALVGILSGGMSGYSMMHTDIGGYVALKVEIGGKTIPVINRTPELFKRWAELNAFTAVMRGNEGITPDLSLQFNARRTSSRTSRAARRSTRASRPTGNASSPMLPQTARRSAGISSCTTRTTPTPTASATSSCSAAT